MVTARLCGKRRELRATNHTSDEARHEYQQVNREVRKQMKARKEEWIEEQCEVIERDIDKGNSKEAYNTLKTLKLLIL